MEKANRHMRGQIQNTSFQIQNVAVQIAAGTAWSRAIGQQLPQLLGGFHALGAVFSAVVAVGVPLGAMFLNSAEAGAKYEDAVKSLRDAQSRLNDTTDLASLPLSDLIDTYDMAAQRVHNMAKAQLQLNIVIARGELENSLTSLREVTNEYTKLGVGLSTYLTRWMRCCARQHRSGRTGVHGFPRCAATLVDGFWRFGDRWSDMARSG